MAQNTTIELPRGEWVLITNADVTSITFQNKGANTIQVAGTIGAVAPLNDDGAIDYEPTLGEANRPLSDLWMGIAATRVYAKSQSRTGSVLISHG